MQEYKHLKNVHDENCKEKNVALKKTSKVKTYITAHRKIYTKPVRQLHQKFKENFDFTYSLSTLYKYKPFNIGPPTEQEKESCLCIKCENAHLFKKGSTISEHRKN